jgi:hypothetical protein
MAAPTNAAKREKSPCQPGAVHTWHKADIVLTTVIVRSSARNGHDTSSGHYGNRQGFAFTPKPAGRITRQDSLEGLTCKLVRFSAVMATRIYHDFDPKMGQEYELRDRMLRKACGSFVLMVAGELPGDPEVEKPY